jgi:hypothetical protein
MKTKGERRRARKSQGLADHISFVDVQNEISVGESGVDYECEIFHFFFPTFFSRVTFMWQWKSDSHSLGELTCEE